MTPHRMLSYYTVSSVKEPILEKVRSFMELTAFVASPVLFSVLWEHWLSGAGNMGSRSTQRQRTYGSMLSMSRSASDKSQNWLVTGLSRKCAGPPQSIHQ